ncbi:uncharacterized protein LOC124149388 [Haliotis rufescens]|uniref:uncharacterized protein LOC124149388 n=1 Tax=Haliotis rufescens TaxID=6454 RepID=UPI00201EE47D|nr:uncharacterized protein LOC124149388 [Haliotis rufescens]
MASVQFRQALLMLKLGMEDSPPSDVGEDMTCPRCLPSSQLDYSLFRRCSLEVPDMCLCKDSRRQSVHWADESHPSLETPRSQTSKTTKAKRNKPRSILKTKDSEENS